MALCIQTCYFFDFIILLIYFLESKRILLIKRNWDLLFQLIDLEIYVFSLKLFSQILPFFFTFWGLKRLSKFKQAYIHLNKLAEGVWHLINLWVKGRFRLVNIGDSNRHHQWRTIKNFLFYLFDLYVKLALLAKNFLLFDCLLVIFLNFLPNFIFINLFLSIIVLNFLQCFLNKRL